MPTKWLNNDCESSGQCIQGENMICKLPSKTCQCKDGFKNFRNDLCLSIKEEERKQKFKLEHGLDMCKTVFSCPIPMTNKICAYLPEISESKVCIEKVKLNFTCKVTEQCSATRADYVCRDSVCNCADGKKISKYFFKDSKEDPPCMDLNRCYDDVDCQDGLVCRGMICKTDGETGEIGTVWKVVAGVCIFVGVAGFVALFVVAWRKKPDDAN